MGNCGTVYRLALDGGLSVVHGFIRAQGCNPVGHLALGPDGDFYGTTYRGGSADLGTVYKVTPAGTFTLLRSFTGSPGGSQPYAALTLGPDDMFYGSTTLGSSAGGGLLFRISSDAAVFEVLYNGINTQAALTLGSDGDFYGTTLGGSLSVGSVFRLTTGGVFTTLYQFPFQGSPPPPPPMCPCPEGSQLLGELVEGPDGSFYGTTSLNGPSLDDFGTVFKFSLDGTLTMLHAFSKDPGASTYSQGREPWAGLTLGTDGQLYGVAISGGAGSNGVIYRISTTGDFTVLRSFDGVDGGSSQEGRLFEESPGVFYGTTNGGRVYKLTTLFNNAPVAVDDDVPTDEDQSVNGVLSASDADGDSLTFSIDTNGTLGTAIITDDATGAFTYMPNPNANGIDSFTFRANDGTEDSNVATVTVTIAPVNDAPVASDGSLTTAEDTPVAGTLVAADDGVGLTFTIVTNGTRGVATITNAATGAFTYTPNPDANGPDAFIFQASDATLASNVATVSVTIDPVDDEPAAREGVSTTTPGTPVSGTLEASDPDGGATTFAITSLPTQGSVVLTDATTGAFTYTPNAAASGYDSFTFEVSGGAGGSAMASAASTTSTSGTYMLFIVVTAPQWPGQTVRVSVAGDGTQGNNSSGQETALSADGRFVAFFSGASTLVAGDTNGISDIFVHDRQTGETRRVSVASDGTQGNDLSVRPALSADGRFVAFASGASNLVAADTNLTYDVFVRDRMTGETRRVSVASDGTQSNSASVEPALSADGRFVAFDSFASTLVAGDTNATWDIFVVGGVSVTPDSQSAAAGGAAGSVDVTFVYPGTSWTATSDDPWITITDQSSTTGNGTVSFTVAPNSGPERTGTLTVALQTVTVTQDEATAPVAENAATSTDEDVSVSGTLVATDPNGDALTFSIVANGTLGIAFITDASTGAFTYTPNPNANGSDSFTFQASDGTLTSNVATVSVTINPVNDAPVAQNGVASTFMATPVNGTLVATDIDSPALTFATATNGSKGTAVITNTATGAYTYTPAAGQSGIDTFTFRANDGALDSNVATVTVSIASNRPPVASNGSLTTTEDRTASGTLGATDPDGNPLTFAIVSNGSLGTATITNAAMGRYRYVPQANANGTDTFTFQASDGTEMSSVATVTVTITPVNDAPIAVNSAVATNVNTPVSGNLNATDVDAGDTLTFSIARAPRRGTLVAGINGAFTYTPRAGFVGTDSFTFRASDGTATSGQATVTVTVSN